MPASGNRRRPTPELLRCNAKVIRPRQVRLAAVEHRPLRSVIRPSHPEQVRRPMKVTIDEQLTDVLRATTEEVQLVDRSGILVASVAPSTLRAEFDEVMRNRDPNEPTLTTEEVLERLQQVGIE